MTPAIFCLSLTKSHEDVFRSFFGERAYILSSLGEASNTVVRDLIKSRKARVEAAEGLLAPLCGGRWWPAAEAEKQSLLVLEPKSLSAWRLRNMVLLAACGHVVFVVDEVSSGNLDLTQHLAAAKVLGATSVGLLSVGYRTSIDTTQLTMADIIAVTEEPRVAALVLKSLTEEPK